MEMKVSKGTMQKISILVLAAMLFSMAAGFLPGGMFANAEGPQVWRYEENISSLTAEPEGTLIDVSQNYSSAKTTFYGSTTYTDAAANTGNSYLVGQTFINEPEKGNQKSLSANITLTDGAGTYKVEFYNPLTNASNDVAAKFDITGKDGQVTTVNNVNTGTAGWVTLAESVELDATVTVKGTGMTTGKNIRYDSIRFTKAGTDEPDEPVEDTIYKFYDAWKANSADITSKVGITDGYKADEVNTSTAVQPGDSTVGTKYFNLKSTANVQNMNLVANNVQLPKSGNYVVSLYNPMGDGPNPGDPNQTIYHTNQGKIIITDKNGTVADTTFDFTQECGWYEIGTYSFDASESIKIEFIEPDAGKNMRIDAMKFVYTTEDIPAASANPTLTPSAGPVDTKIYDNNDPSGDTEVELILPPDTPPGADVGSSGTGNVSVNATHGYCSLFNSSAVYTLKNTSSGKFKVEFIVPLVHSNNTNEMYVEVKDSTGKVVRKVFDIRDANSNGTSASGIQTGDWISMGEDFVFYNSNAPVVTFGKGAPGEQVGVSDTGTPIYSNNGHFRYDGVRITRVADVESVPLAVNMKIEGKIAPNEVLTGSYDYVSDDSASVEGASVIKWYTKSSEDGEYTLQQEKTKNDADCLKYTLKENELFIKMEVLPKDAEGKEGPKAEFELGAVLPKVKNVAIEGRLRPGAELKGSYEYVHDNGTAEKDSVYTWFAKAKEGDDYTQVAQGTTTAEQGASYITKPGERFIKLEITPKCDTSVSSLVTGETAFAEFDVVNDKDSAPVAENLVIQGEAVALGQLTAQYTFTDINKDLEKDSEYKWLAASSENATEWRVLASGKGTASDAITYQIPETFPAGEYIKLELTPKSDAGEQMTGKTVTSNVIGPVVIAAIKPEVKDAAFGGYSVAAEGIEGLATNGEAEIAYTYVNKTGIAEDTEKTQFQWYVSDNSSKGFEPIDGATSRTYTVPESMKGKFIKVGIVPHAVDGTVGTETFTNAEQVKYNLAFYDDFDYTAADGYDEHFRTMWTPDAALRELSGIKSARIPENVKVEDGKMIILNRKEHNDKYNFEHTWTTASINSKDTYGPYGYYEASYKYAWATGLNQSFWTIGGGNKYNGPDQPQMVELDFNEGHFPRDMASNLHYFSENNSRITNSIHRYPIGANDYYNIEGPTLADNFNIYGGYFKPNDPNYDWNAKQNQDTFQVFFNNDQIRSTQSLPYDNVAEQKIIFSIAIYPGFGGPLYQEETGDPNKPTADGTQMEIEYVRYYELLDVSHETLSGAISLGESIVAETEVGSGFLQCPKATMDSLINAIAAAKSVLNNPSATEIEKNAQAALVNNAIYFVNRGLNTKGNVSEGKTYDLTDITSALAPTIPRDVANCTFVFPEAALNQISITVQATGQEIMIPKGTRLSGTFTVPQSISYTADGITVKSAVSSCNLTAQEGLIQIKLSGAQGYKVAALENGQLREITKQISENTLGAATSAIGTANEVIVYADGSAYVWAKAAGSYVVYKDAAAEPSPTPTPDYGGGNGNNGGGNYPGGGGYIPMPKPSDSGNKVNFTDISGHWAENTIRSLAQDGIIKGKSESIFAPDDNMTRAEFAALIRRAVGLNPSIYQGGFTDVSDSAWYANEIQAIVNAGIMSGDADGNFRPEDLISREEMAKVAVNAFMYRSGAADVTGVALSFSDSNEISGWAVEYVEKAAALNLINGMDDGSFAPNSYMTRAQGTVVISRVIQ